MVLVFAGEYPAMAARSAGITDNPLFKGMNVGRRLALG